jgi:hypothetical protein
MVKKIISLLPCCLFVCIGFCQDSTKAGTTKEQKKQERKERINELAKKYEEGQLVYNKQSAFAFKLNTDGWGAFYEHGKYKDINTTNLWWFELGEHKDHKEEKQAFIFDNGFFAVSGNPFIYGKQNNFYTAKIGIGQQRLIGSKGNKNGVAVSGIYGGGFSAALVKPYYIQIQDPLTSINEDVKYQGAGDTLFLNPAYIIGGSGFGKGFGEIEFTPGFHARAALRFDYGQYNELLSAIEVGINAEYYTKSIPIMVNGNAKKFFFNAYVAIEVGKRK